MEAWNPCLQEAFQLVAFAVDIGVEIKVGADVEDMPILKVRDPARQLSPGLRTMLLARQDDIIGLFSRYDEWRAGQPGPLREAANWPEAVTSLTHWLGIGMGEELGPDFFSECQMMRLVWDGREDQR